MYATQQHFSENTNIALNSVKMGNFRKSMKEILQAFYIPFESPLVEDFQIGIILENTNK